MTTLLLHVEKLAKHCEDSPELILWSILHNERIMDEDTLFVYAINRTPIENELVMLWSSGNGDKIYEWVKELQRKYQCPVLSMVTKRWKAISRKYKMKQVGVMLEREGYLQ